MLPLDREPSTKELKREQVRKSVTKIVGEPLFFGEDQLELVYMHTYIHTQHVRTYIYIYIYIYYILYKYYSV